MSSSLPINLDSDSWTIRLKPLIPLRMGCSYYYMSPYNGTRTMRLNTEQGRGVFILKPFAWSRWIVWFSNSLFSLPSSAIDPQPKINIQTRTRRRLLTEWQGSQDKITLRRDLCIIPDLYIKQSIALLVALSWLCDLGNIPVPILSATSLAA